MQQVGVLAGETRMLGDDHAKHIKVCKTCKDTLKVTAKQISLWTLLIWLLALASLSILWFAPELVIIGK